MFRQPVPAGACSLLRIGYVYLERYGVVLLILAYEKGEKDDLTPDDKKAIRKVIEKIEKEFAKRPIK